MIKVFYPEENIIVERNIKEVICEIVAAQIDVDYEFEALKVQSIIARTLLVRKSKLFGAEGCSLNPDSDICLTEHCIKAIPKEKLKEKYKGEFERVWKKLKDAEEETDKLIITFNNKVIDPKYHLSCGGATENSENVDNNKVVYLRKVLCDHCREMGNQENIKDITLDELLEKLDIKINKISAYKGSDVYGIIEEIERDEHGRVRKIKIGDKIFKGTELAELLGLDTTRAV